MTAIRLGTEEALDEFRRVISLIESDLPETVLELRELKVNFETGDITISRG